MSKRKHWLTLMLFSEFFGMASNGVSADDVNMKINNLSTKRTRIFSQNIKPAQIVKIAVPALSIPALVYCVVNHISKNKSGENGNNKEHEEYKNDGKKELSKHSLYGKIKKEHIPALKFFLSKKQNNEAGFGVGCLESNQPLNAYICDGVQFLNDDKNIVDFCSSLYEVGAKFFERHKSFGFKGNLVFTITFSEDIKEPVFKISEKKQSNKDEIIKVLKQELEGKFGNFSYIAGKTTLKEVEEYEKLLEKSKEKD